jgi:predicted nucleic acid-binding protein
MRVLALYLDSSVLGGYFDPEFEEATRQLWQEMDQGRFVFVSSVVVDQEISNAPQRVRDLMAETFDQSTILQITPEVEILSAAYIKKKIVPARYANDATHVAMAVVHGVSVLVSWNFKHLVNYQRETAFNGVNLLEGYPPIRITTPRELINEPEGNEDV